VSFGDAAVSKEEQRIEELEHELRLLREEVNQSARMKRLWQASNEKLKQARARQLALQKELEERLLELEKARSLLESIASNDKAIIENMSEGVLITSPDGIIQEVNPAFESITGYAAAEVIGKSPAMLKSGRHPQGFYEQFWFDLKEKSGWRGEFTNVNAAGEIYIQDTSITQVKDWNGRTVNYVAVIQDITEKKRNEEKLRALALRDNLTGLSNRRLFKEHVSTALRLATRRELRFAILFIDLDGFKPINDRFGHDAGDRVLKVLAQRIKFCLRESDEASRFGGDEFTMLLTAIDTADDARVAAQRVLSVLKQPIECEGEDVTLGASIGIAMYPDDGGDYDGLIKRADERMYRAKNAGKGCICHQE
jgi:diguanylate cyclase (GGDEF)-like protein/PAS domain S-box-containing protein